MLRTPRRPGNDDERILPLINIVFLLLIFFMLAGRLSASDLFQVEPPQSVSEGRTDAAALDVLVAGDGRIAVDGTLVELAGLKDVLVASMAEAGDRPVRLKADAGSDTVRIVEVMEMLRQAGIGRVQLLTVTTEG